MTCLDVTNLSVTTRHSEQDQAILSDVSFRLQRGQVFVIIGESGSGKSTLCRALTRLVPNRVFETSGSVELGSKDLMQISEKSLRQIRRTEIRYIFQEPQQALNPALTIRTQMKFSAGVQGRRSDVFLKALDSVGLQNGEDILSSYPHQLSIGMAQRVLIAMALLPSPSLLIADEPTSALDAVLRFNILDLLKTIQARRQMTMLLVTHDLEVARRYADEVAVLQNGRIIEQTTASDFFKAPQHPYSRLLLNSVRDARKRTAIT